jgi:cephalosporin hydroxylase
VRKITVCLHVCRGLFLSLFPITADMSLYFRTLKKLAGQAVKRPGLRPVISSASRKLAGGRAGGLVLVDEDELYRAILRERGTQPSKSLADYIAEVRGDEALRATFEENRTARKLTKYTSYDDRIDKLRAGLTIYYALVREIKPQCLVETGTAAGSLTSFLLAALARNGTGTLHSIDIPPNAGKLTMDITVAAPEVGYFIPEAYRSRWNYIEGDAKIHLPRLLSEHEVDWFIHDSLHTRTHMLFEYTVARALMPEKAILVSDDVLWNNSFCDFLRTNQLRGYSGFSNLNIGIALNLFDDFEREIGLGIIRTPKG